MSDRRTISYFRIGSFVITGLILITIGILILASGILFKHVEYAETYFKESVQGLSEGSPVKYLGMEIGSVVEVNTIDNVYHLESGARKREFRYIYVKMAITPKFFPEKLSHDQLKILLDRFVSHGLRVKLSPQGLTGNSFLEISFVKPEDAQQVLPIAWQPQDFYIPSVPSTLAYFTENAQYLLNELRKVDIQKLFDNFGELILTTNGAMQRANNAVQHTDQILMQNSQQLTATINNLQSITENISSLSQRAQHFPSHVIFGKPPPRLDPSKL